MQHGPPTGYPVGGAVCSRCGQFLWCEERFSVSESVYAENDSKLPSSARPGGFFVALRRKLEGGHDWARTSDLTDVNRAL